MKFHWFFSGATCRVQGAFRVAKYRFAIADAARPLVNVALFLQAISSIPGIPVELQPVGRPEFAPRERWVLCHQAGRALEVREKAGM